MGPRWRLQLFETGDETQLATVVLAARYDRHSAVMAGTMLGKMLANAPVAWPGGRITWHLPLRAVCIVSSAVFIGRGEGALLM